MNISDVEKLIKLVSESGVAEVEVCFSRFEKIRVSKVAGQVQVQPVSPALAPAATHTPATTPPASKETVDKSAEVKSSRPANLVAIKSPMIGTFYRAPAPDAQPYVEVGDTVKPGTVVCIVEAMKLMNEIESDITGKVVEILVQNETPVEYGQELFLIEPS